VAPGVSPVPNRNDPAGGVPADPFIDFRPDFFKAGFELLFPNPCIGGPGHEQVNVAVHEAGKNRITGKIENIFTRQHFSTRTDPFDAAVFDLQGPASPSGLSAAVHEPTGQEGAVSRIHRFDWIAFHKKRSNRKDAKFAKNCNLYFIKNAVFASFAPSRLNCSFLNSLSAN
jgi:hypothetical protein